MTASGLKEEILHELEIRDVSLRGRWNSVIFRDVCKRIKLVLDIRLYRG
jgi:hypothetical protein